MKLSERIWGRPYEFSDPDVQRKALIVRRLMLLGFAFALVGAVLSGQQRWLILASTVPLIAVLILLQMGRYNTAVWTLLINGYLTVTVLAVTHPLGIYSELSMSILMLMTLAAALLGRESIRWVVIAGVITMVITAIFGQSATANLSDADPVPARLGITIGMILISGFLQLAVLSRVEFNNRRLRVEVAERRAAEEALAAARDEAVQSSDAKTRFLANMSHEIRTPMNAIVSISRIMAESDLPAAQRENAEVVCQSSESLLNIINDILDFSRVEAGQLEILSRPVEIEPLVANLVRLLDGAARAKEIYLSYRVASNVAPWLRCDPVRLEQILINLVGNAIKFTERGLVSIDVTGAPEGRLGTVAFSVSDTGIGIPDKDVDRVFEPFTQYDGSMTRRHDGTGLGLSICRSLVSLMGGEIWVSSAPEVGSIFAFTLNAPAVTHSAAEGPLSLSELTSEGSRQSVVNLTELADRSRTPVSALTLQWTAEMSAAAAGLKVLVAEDNKVNRLVICRLLGQLGIVPQTVENGAEAIAAVSADRFDLVFMDISMPEVDGIEAVRVIRESVPAPPSLVALTAHALVGDRERFIGAGFDDYISKPVHPNELQKIVRQVLDYSQSVEGPGGSE